MGAMEAKRRVGSLPRMAATLLSVLLSVLLLALASSGCADNTALRLVIRSNLAIPSEIDGLRIEIQAASGARVPARIVPLRDVAFPQTLVVLPESGSMSGPVTFTVQGLHDNVIMIQRVVVASFQAGRVIDVELELNSDCYEVECGSGADCLRGVCRQVEPTDGGISDAAVADAPWIIADAGQLDAPALDAPAPEDAAGEDAFAALDAPAPLDAFELDAAAPSDAYTAPDAPTACAGAACIGAVVISEFAYEGSGGGIDEFVELYNRSSLSADIGGLNLRYVSASGASPAIKATVPAGTRLPPGGFYLLVGRDYPSSGVTTPDASTRAPWTDGASSAGGAFWIELSSAVLDRVCWGSASPAACDTGGSAIPATQPTPGSFERRAVASSTPASMSAGGADEHAGNGYDTNDTAADFLVRSLREPQNTASPHEP